MPGRDERPSIKFLPNATPSVMLCYVMYLNHDLIQQNATWKKCNCNTAKTSVKLICICTEAITFVIKILHGLVDANRDVLHLNVFLKSCPIHLFQQSIFVSRIWKEILKWCKFLWRGLQTRNENNMENISLMTMTYKLEYFIAVHKKAWLYSITVSQILRII